MPKVNSNVKRVKGWIDQTLPEFASKTSMARRSRSCTSIWTDELLGYPGWTEHAYKALTEIVDPLWEADCISFCEPVLGNGRKDKYVRAAIQITGRCPAATLR